MHLFLIQTISYQIQSKHSNNLFTLVIKHQRVAQLGGTFQMGGYPQIVPLRWTEPNTTSTSNL